MMFDNVEDAAAFFTSNPGECLTFWVETCWPDGLFCSECECLIDELPEDGNGRHIQCPDCGQRVNVFETSLLEHSRIELSYWLSIIWNATCYYKESRAGHDLADLLGCNYHKIRHAIKAVDQVKSQLHKRGIGRRGNKFEAVVRGCSSADIPV